MSKEDALGRGKFIQQIIEVIQTFSGSAGCCFGIDGVWGCGKTFLLNELRKKLQDEQSEKTHGNKYYISYYNCWEQDYYDEPLIAIIVMLIDEIEEHFNILHGRSADIAKAFKERIKGELYNLLRELVKKKTGIDLLGFSRDIIKAGEVIQKTKIEFDIQNNFKKVLKETKALIRKIAEGETVIILVDELDRCPPAYAIKTLERLHHLFAGMNNVFVIIATDKSQLEHSIKQIYGNIDVDKYLRKIVEFQLTLDAGVIEKIALFNYYFDDFEKEGNRENKENYKFVFDMFTGLDMRSCERIIRKANIMHALVWRKKQKADISWMYFEILVLSVSYRLFSNNIKWLIGSQTVDETELEIKLGNKYFQTLMSYRKNLRKEHQKPATGQQIYEIKPGDKIGKAFFLIAVMYFGYRMDGISGDYKLEIETHEIETVQLFADYMKIINCN